MHSFSLFIFGTVDSLEQRDIYSNNRFYSGKKINRVACGSAHSLAWSTNKPVSAGKLPTAIPMEYNHLQSLPITTLRNRIVLLHHFSDLFCPSICMFDLQDHSGEKADVTTGLDRLRGVIVSSAKVGYVLKRVVSKGHYRVLIR